MDERAVMQRLDRIDALQREGAPAADLLDEVRRLLHAAERLAGAERDAGLHSAVERCRDALAAGGAERWPGDGAALEHRPVDRVT